MADETARWHDVVYGRTPQVDNWWRVTPAVPAIPDLMSWLSSAVHAVVAGGDGLEHPRYLLAQDARLRLVGMACRAAHLSDTMNTDTGRPEGRALYTFVGWLAVNDGAGFPPTPDLPGLIEGAVRWSKPVYDRWAGLTWHETPSQARTPHHSDAEFPRWRTVVGTAPAPRSAKPEAATAQENLQLVPERDIAAIWHAALPARQTILVTSGWHTERAVPRRTAMYAGVEDIDTRISVALAPPRAEANVTWAQRQAEKGHAEGGRRDGGLWDRLKGPLGEVLNELRAEIRKEPGHPEAPPDHAGYSDSPATSEASPGEDHAVRREPPRQPPGAGPMRRYLHKNADSNQRSDDAEQQKHTDEAGSEEPRCGPS